MGDWTVDIQDFQSIKKGRVTISSGLNIVTGPTNRGKSAIIRAIDCSIFNKGTDDFIRAGASILGVTISNGRHSMTYCRNRKGASEKTAYKFDDGTVQRKVGRNQLPEVKDMFGISDVRMKNDVSMKLNFWYQNDKPFLMDKTPGQLYEFISLSSADKYVKILKQIQSDIKIQEAEINNANSTIDTLKVINLRKQDFVSKNTGFDEIYESIVVADDECKKLNEVIKRLQDLEELRKQIETLTEGLKKVSSILDSVPTAKISKDYEVLNDMDDNFSSLYNSLSNTISSRDSIMKVQGMLTMISSRYESSLVVFNHTKDPVNSISDEDSFISRIYTNIKNLQNTGEYIKSTNDKIAELKSISEQDVERLETSILGISGNEEQQSALLLKLIEMRNMMTEIQSLQVRIQGTEDRTSECEEELNRFKSEVGYCPFCGSVFCNQEH